MRMLWVLWSLGSSRGWTTTTRRRIAPLRRLLSAASTGDDLDTGQHHLLPRLYVGERPKLCTVASLTELTSLPSNQPSILSTAKKLTLDEDQSHYLTSVLRLTKKSSRPALVRLMDGQSGEWLAQVSLLDTSKRKSSVVAECLQQLRPPPAITNCSPILCTASLKKKERLRWLLEKATELSVAAIVLLDTDHSEAPGVSVDKMLAYLVLAAEQCERLTVPALVRLGGPTATDAGPTTPLSVLLDQIANQDRVHLLIGRERCSQSRSAWTALQESSGHDVAFLMGPEGGWSTEEQARLDQLPATTTSVTGISLGPTVLRAETAAITALAAYTLYSDHHHKA